MASSILIEYESFLNRSIWPIDGTLTDGSEGNGNEGVTQYSPNLSNNEGNNIEGY